MRMPPYWERTIRARWFSLLCCGFLAWPGSVRLPAQPAPAALLGQGVRAAQEARYEEAARHLKAARPGLKQLADHVGYWLGWVEYQRKNYRQALAELEPVWHCPIASPLAGKAALLAARAHLAAGAPEQAAALLRARSSLLPQPEGETLLAAALEAAGDLAAAAAAYQRVYYGYPAAPEAAVAQKELARLRLRLGEAYPPPMPQQMLERADYWVRARQYRRARAEYEHLIPQLGGRERELARVRVGAALYLDYDTAAAWDYLRSLDTADPAAEAERLYYLVECARRWNREAEMTAWLEELARRRPASEWRLKALISAGNRYLLDNLAERYEPLYRACYEGFPPGAETAYCHWKVAWSRYLKRSPEAGPMLREHLKNYPGSEKAPAALYFLGRLAEAAGQREAAKVWYQAITERFPNYYYAQAARERLARPELAGAPASGQAAAFLRTLAWPERPPGDGFRPNAACRLRLERARLLSAAGLSAMAEEELRFGAGADGQPQIAALELGRLLAKKAPVHQALRQLKPLVPGYLGYAWEAAPEHFWRLLFPFPYRSLIEKHARRHNLDPFLVAGLLRQESEFNPGAVSPARAYGLAQILPSQGRLLARQLKLPRYRTSMLFQPDFNLRLGTYYLRTLLDKYGGRLEAALAAYNAGPNRLEQWLSWGSFEDPAELIETIPFTETRTYIQAVLRNAEIYRRLYGSAPPSVMRKAAGKARPSGRPK